MYNENLKCILSSIQRLYDNAVRRYEEQEKDFNKLAKCYNAVYDNGGKICNQKFFKLDFWD